MNTIIIAIAEGMHTCIKSLKVGHFHVFWAVGLLCGLWSITSVKKNNENPNNFVMQNSTPHFPPVKLEPFVDGDSLTCSNRIAFNSTRNLGTNSIQFSQTQQHTYSLIAIS